MAEMKRGRAIAIVGAAGRFPSAADLDELWAMLLEGRSASKDVPADRWPVAKERLLDPSGAPDRLLSTKGCFLEPFSVATEGFEVDPALVASLDPLHALALDVGAAAFRDAKLPSIDRARIPVILANIVLPTDAASKLSSALASRGVDGAAGAIPPASKLNKGLTSRGVDGSAGASPAPSASGAAALSPAQGAAENGEVSPLDRQPAALPAALLSRALGLGGGSYTLDAACASSLYALHLACLELEAGRADAVLAGGVSRPQALYTQVGFTQLQALSPSGSCSPFDISADGLVVGEGAAIFVLRRLDDAIRDGERILGVIRGVGLSNDLGGGLLSPDSEGQLRAMRAAYEQAGWCPQDVQFIECHGTGTPRGDEVELASLRALFTEEGSPLAGVSRIAPGGDEDPGDPPPGRGADSPAAGADSPAAGADSPEVVIGSVKGNVGHLLTAAAATGLAKVLLALREKTLPPNANFSASTAAPGLRGSPFTVLEEARPWEPKAQGLPRRAAISAFGFGGTNAHLLLEEWLGDPPAPSSESSSTGAAPEQRASPPSPGAAAPASTSSWQQASLPSPAAKAAVRSDASGRDRAAGGANTPTPIAIVGMATHFGRLKDLGAYREAIFRGAPVLDPRPPHRWAGAQSAHLALDELRGAWIDELEIPLGRFRIPPNELPSLLPQQLLALEVAAAALEDAGAQALGPAPRLRTGALIGLGLDLETTNFHLRWLAEERGRGEGAAHSPEGRSRHLEEALAELGPPLDAPRTLGALGGVVAGRIARELQLGGPSFSLAGEDASGLRALEAAVRLLQAGDVDSMLVGAVDLAGDLRQLEAADTLRPWSRANQPRPFDEEADGPTVGEGAAAVVVKRLDDALRDGDRIYAVIRGVGAASGGTLGEGPSVDAYSTALERAWSEAALEPRQLGLLEADGSGDPALDRLEALALQRFFGETDEKRSSLSAAKAVIGHTGAAAGLASLVKAALSLFHELLPPLPGFREPAHEGWERSPFHMQREAQAWLRNRADGPRAAGVSSIGLDGSCVHAVLEGFDHRASAHRVERARPLGDRGVGLFVCGGEDEGALLASIDALRAHLDEAGLPIEALAASWYRGQPEAQRAPKRRAFVAADRDELLRALERPSRIAKLSGEIAFVFPGSGNHYVGMGKRLGALFPEPIRALDAETEHLRDQMMPAWFAPWRSSWERGAERRAALALEGAPERMILGQVAYGIAMSDVVRWLGVEPQAYIGYSLGESAALFSSRAWPDRDGMFSRTLSSPLFRSQLAGENALAQEAWGGGADAWHVAVVNRGADEVRQALRGDASLLIVNAPGECVLGGPRSDVEAAIRALGCEAIPLTGVPTVHCELVAPVAEAYRALHLQETTPPKGPRFYSCGWASPYVPTRERAAESILTNAVEGFDFQRTIERAWDDGVRIFVELGPQGSCARMIGRILADKEHLAVSTCQRDLDPARSLLRALALLVEAGVPVELDRLYGAQGGFELVEQASPAKVIRVLNGRVPTKRSAASNGVAVSPRPENTNKIQPPTPPAERRMSPSPAPASAETTPPAPPSPALDMGTPPPSAPSPARAEMTPPALPPAQATMRTFSPHASPPQLPSLMSQNSSLAAVVAELATLTHGVLESSHRNVAAHGTFLQTTEQHGVLLQAALAGEQRLRALLGAPGAYAAPTAQAAPVAPQSTAPAQVQVQQQQGGLQAQQPGQVGGGEAAPPAFDRELCMEFAIGKLGNVLGPEFAVVDSYPTRVRLPDEPLMLVDRILTVEGTKGVLGSGRCVTEHDVLPGAWYLDGGRAPVCISVESGQADLFLCAYLGIDLITKGERVYRLLDAQVIFHRDLPAAGETVRYDIRVDRFIRQGDTHLLFFEFDGTIGGEPLITMRGGCAGFFSPAQLASGRGIVGDLPSERPPRRLAASGSPTEPFTPFVPVEPTTYDERALDALRAGDLGAAFGPAFEGITLPEGLRLPDGRMRLVDRILELDPAGGRYGLGRVMGEADIDPEAWFLTSHFMDDQVMPGTLMYECCLHTLRVMLLRMGWAVDEASAPADLHYAPVVGQPSKLRCRGQVTPTTKKARYRIDIKEIGYDPEPYVLADASMYVDDLHAVEMESMSVRLVGLDRETLERQWGCKSSPLSAEASALPSASAAAAPAQSGVDALFRDPDVFPLERTDAGRPRYDRRHIEAFATGRPSQAFGAPYRRFDEGRMARLPSDPLSYIDTIVPVAGEPWTLEAGAKAKAIYEVPSDAWYFDASRLEQMPYAVLLEAALQPCGWLAAWSGAALESDEPLFFRNLEGSATVHAAVPRSAGVLTTDVHLDLVSRAGGMILLQFAFETASARGPILSGTTRFGFFGEAALASQAGIRLPSGGIWRPESPAGGYPIEATPPLRPEDLLHATIAAKTAAAAEAKLETRASENRKHSQAGLHLPAGAYRLLDHVDALLLDGGPHGQGTIMGSKMVDPADWFFAAHFHGDPVMPGSLGLDALIQLLQHWARARWPSHVPTHRFVCMPAPAPHRWTYRGQVLQKTKKMELVAHIKTIHEGPSPGVVADGFLLADGKAIYSMEDFTLRLEEP